MQPNYEEDPEVSALRTQADEIIASLNDRLAQLGAVYRYSAARGTSVAALSARTQRIQEAHAEGLTDAEIAERLRVDPVTVAGVLSRPIQNGGEG